MHSKRKLLAKYHGLDLSYIEELYGLGPNNLLTQKVFNNREDSFFRNALSTKVRKPRWK